jgi:cell division protein FtsQ
MSTTMTPTGPTTGSVPRVTPIHPPEVPDDLSGLPDPPVIRAEPPVVLLPGAVDVDAEAEPVLHIEPKLRARRIEVRRAARRHRRRMVIAVALLVALVGATAGVLYSPLLDVDHLRVAGAAHVGERAVISASGIATGDQLVDLDLARARRRIGRIPWVRNVRIERHWPDSVVIRITERAAVATVETSGGRKLAVTTGGVVAGRATAFDLALPVVRLETGAPEVGDRLPRAVARATEMVGAMPLAVRMRMRHASISALGDVSVSLVPSGEIRFGRAEDVAAKFLAAQTILGGSVDLAHLCRLDVRIPTAPTLSRSC